MELELPFSVAMHASDDAIHLDHQVIPFVCSIHQITFACPSPMVPEKDTRLSVVVECEDLSMTIAQVTTRSLHERGGSITIPINVMLSTATPKLRAVRLVSSPQLHCLGDETKDPLVVLSGTQRMKLSRKQVRVLRSA
jgi:hypothetical protein